MAESGNLDLGEPASHRGRAGHDHDGILVELEHVIGGHHDTGPDGTRSANAGMPKSIRTTSLAGVAGIVDRRVDHLDFVNIEGSTRQLRADPGAPCDNATQSPP